MWRVHRPSRILIRRSSERVRGSLSPRWWFEWCPSRYWHGPCFSPPIFLTAAPQRPTAAMATTPATVRSTPWVSRSVRIFLVMTGILHLFLSSGGILLARAEQCYPVFQSMTISSSTVNVSSAFDCDNGIFDVHWLGVVSVSESIVLGNDTTVFIKGNYDNGLRGDGDGITETDDASSNGSAVIASGSAFGPIFVVIDSSLSLEGIAVRNGSASGGASIYDMGGGVYAKDANIVATDCEFENNFGEGGGGGMNVVQSTLSVTDTVFRGCSAGLVPDAGADDVEGAGGAIKVRSSDIFVTGSVFEGCYAADKGGALDLSTGGLTVTNSVFANNSAGSGNVKDEDPVGEGGAVSISTCTGGFQGDGDCSFSDTEFVGNKVAHKGGTISLSGDSDRSDVELSSCSVVDGTAGEYIEDDPQGEGGAFSVGANSSLVLINSTTKGCFAGDKGGAITLSGGDSWTSPGATLVVSNSTFTENESDGGSGGVIYCNVYSTVVVMGNDSIFTDNYSAEYGGVLAAASDTDVTIEGGEFSWNQADENGAVIWTKGDAVVYDGHFHDNCAGDRGGVFDTSEGGSLEIIGGVFKSNEGGDYGGVGYVTSGSVLHVMGGTFETNSATYYGGVFMVEAASDVVITGGYFQRNAADSGGFLFKEGSGNASCSGALISENVAADGGALYAIDDATLEWQCDLRTNYAVTGSSIYAMRANVTLYRMMISGSDVLRAAEVMLIDSDLYTIEVVFSQSFEVAGFSAVQVEDGSTYYAEGTRFEGIDDSAVISSEGELVLDNCDFRDCSAVPLVYTQGENATTQIRNAILGDNNYEEAFELASDGDLRMVSLINVDLSCTDGIDGDGDAFSQVCSEGSPCLDGDLGVYCRCYSRPSTGTEVCLTDDPSAELTLTVSSSPEETYYPELPQGDLLLSLSNRTDTTASSGVGSISPGAGVSGSDFEVDGVMWNATVNSSDDRMKWTIIPPTGLIVPGDSVTLRVVSIPDSGFDGAAQYTFRVEGLDLVSEQPLVAETIVNVTYYHCEKSHYWNTSEGSEAAECDLCSDVSGDPYGLDCSLPGYSLSTLLLNSGYWRASITSLYIRECYNEDACIGGSDVDSVDDFCDTGYKGPLCGVCSSGYAPSTGYTCHRCGTGLRISMYVLVGLVGLVVIGLVITLAVFLVAGEHCVKHVIVTVSTTIGGESGCRPQTSRSAEEKEVDHTAASDDGATATRTPANPQPITPASGPQGRGVAGHEQQTPGNSVSREAVNGSTSGVTGDLWWSQMGSFFSCFPSPEHNEDARLIPANHSPGETPDPRSTKEITAPPRSKSLGDGVWGGDVKNGESPSAGGMEKAIGWSSTPSRIERDGDGREGLPRRNLEDDRFLSDHYEKKEDDAGQRATPGPGHELGETERLKALAPIALVDEFSEKLHLSRLKLVIVVWQILTAFVDITHVPMPTIYKSFISVVRVVTFDLGWIFSAACITDGMSFYEKLLIITIGPVIVFCFLTLTFVLGILRQRRRHHLAAMAQNVTDPMPRRGTSFAVFSMLRLCLRRSSSGGQAPPRPSPDPQAEQLKETPEGATMHGAGDHPYPILLDDKSGKTFQMRSSDTFASPSLTAAGIARVEERPALELPRVPASSGKHAPEPGELDNSEHNEKWWIFARHTAVSLIILYLIYSQVSTVVLQTFSCQDFPEIDKSYLRADLRLECYTPLHRKYMIYAGFMVVLYPLGIPAAFAYFLVLKRSRINPAVDVSEENNVTKDQILLEKLERRSQDESIASTAFLWDAYLPSRYYYEVCECMRRLLLTGVLVFFSDGSLQMAVACFFSFISLVVFELLQPQRDPVEIQLYRAGCLIIFFTNFLGLVIETETIDDDSTSSAVYAVILVIVNFCLFLATVWDIVADSGLSSEDESREVR